APLSAIPLIWISTFLWHSSANGATLESAGMWLVSTVALGVPINYGALVVLGIPACRVLSHLRVTSPTIFILVGTTAGFVVASIWPRWDSMGWSMIGALVGFWNGAVIWRATDQARRRVAASISSTVGP